MSSLTLQHTKDPRTEAEMIQGFRERLIDAVKERLRADADGQLPGHPLSGFTLLDQLLRVLRITFCAKVIKSALNL